MTTLSIVNQLIIWLKIKVRFCHKEADVIDEYDIFGLRELPRVTSV